LVLTASAVHGHLASFPTRRSSDLFHAFGIVTSPSLRLFGYSGGVETAASPTFSFRRFLLLNSLHEACPNNIYTNNCDKRRQDGSDRKSTRLNSSHVKISYAVFCLK